MNIAVAILSLQLGIQAITPPLLVNKNRIRCTNCPTVYNKTNFTLVWTEIRRIETKTDLTSTNWDVIEVTVTNSCNIPNAFPQQFFRIQVGYARPTNLVDADGIDWQQTTPRLQ